MFKGLIVTQQHVSVLQDNDDRVYFACHNDGYEDDAIASCSCYCCYCFLILVIVAFVVDCVVPPVVQKNGLLLIPRQSQ